jgi:hypothetical protein
MSAHFPALLIAFDHHMMHRSAVKKVKKIKQLSSDSTVRLNNWQRYTV